tara:strand:- start:279 stop:674 length:396 start_codon:yes stop_codon:yes gene_type:complete
MKQKLIIIVLFLLTIELSYSQNVLIDKVTGDTLITISIQQMDGIYIELIQKDSLVDQAKVSRSKEVKLYEVIEITEINLKSSQEALKASVSNNAYLSSESEKSKKKIKRNRNIALFSILFATLEAFILIAT